MNKIQVRGVGAPDLDGADALCLLHGLTPYHQYNLKEHRDCAVMS